MKVSKKINIRQRKIAYGDYIYNRIKYFLGYSFEQYLKHIYQV